MSRIRPVTYRAICQASDGLANQIKAAGRRFDVIICLARGGLSVGALLAYRLGITEVWAFTPGKGSQTIEVECGKGKGSVLWVDAIIETGATFERLEHCRKGGQLHQTAALYVSRTSKFVPDYFSQKYDAERIWVKFPWEI